jgi:hypothetical protein
MKTTRFFLWMMIALAGLNAVARAQSAVDARTVPPDAKGSSAADHASNKNASGQRDADASPRSPKSAGIRNHPAQPKKIALPPLPDTAHEKAIHAEKQRLASATSSPQPRPEMPTAIPEHPAASNRTLGIPVKANEPHTQPAAQAALDGHHFAIPRSPGARMVNSGGPSAKHITEGLNGSNFKPRP